MTDALTIPPRRWGNEPAVEAPKPVVLVSSRDGAEVPHVAGAVRLARAAEAAGWTVRQTYALAQRRATPRRGAHLLASVAVRLARPGLGGWAMWHRVDEQPWKFVDAYIGWERLGFRELVTRVKTP